MSPSRRQLNTLLGTSLMSLSAAPLALAQSAAQNPVGASGNIGTEDVVCAAPDGATLLVSVNTLVMNRALYPGLSFNAVKDLTSVSQTSWRQLLLVTHPKTD